MKTYSLRPQRFTAPFAASLLVYALSGISIFAATASTANALEIGNNATTSGDRLDGWLSNMVINENDTYTNTSGATQSITIDKFSFYAQQVADPVTPFVVRVNGDNKFTVLAVGTTRSTYRAGSNTVPFSTNPPSVTLKPGEKLATGFLDANQNGSGGGRGAVISWDNGGDEIWYTGSTSGSGSGRVAVGAAPVPGDRTLTGMFRTYRYKMSMTVGGTGSSQTSNALTLSTDTLNFGGIDVGATSNPKRVVLRNPGTAPHTLAGISISGNSASSFSQTSNCGDVIPAGGSCAVDVRFTPLGAGTVSASLRVSDYTNASPYPVSLSGTGNSGTVAASSVTSPAANTVLYVNFDKHPGGEYTKAHAIQDFNAETSSDSVNINNTDIVNDPSGNASRGKVMRVKHLANRGGGNGGFRFKATFPAADEYYMAFDFYIPKNYEIVAVEKLPGLMYGTLLDASHGSNEPNPEGVKAFSVLHQLLGPESYVALGGNKFSSYVYDADIVQRDVIFDAVTPETDIISGSNPANAQTIWKMPKGQWVRIEQRIRQNTATSQKGVGVKKDGILQQWVNGKLMVDSRRRFRTVNTMRIDGIYMYSYYGGKAGDPINQPSQTQYEYYDNFIVSKSPITH